MNTDEFVELALRTETDNLPLHVGKTTQANRLLHAAMGMSTEANEFLDPIKKHIFYNKSLDLVNLKEELGDILWYIAIAVDALDTSLGAEMKRVIKKLQVRYPEKYTDAEANERDLFEERKALEE